MAISDPLWLGLLEKSREACGGEIKHAEEATREIMRSKLVLGHQQTKNSPVSFTAYE